MQQDDFLIIRGANPKEKEEFKMRNAAWVVGPLPDDQGADATLWSCLFL